MKNKDKEIQDLKKEIKSLEGVLSLAYDLATHPFLYSESVLKDKSLSTRWNLFTKGMEKHVNKYRSKDE